MVSDTKGSLEELLGKFIKLRQKLYSCDIVFEKYHDLVAISTFYEYFITGRCDKFEGADGAYNLYENEIKMNTVISKLSKVVELLEDIKENQFTLYKAISSVNTQLKLLTEDMNKAIASLGSIIQSEHDKTNDILKTIENNSEYIAYNTAATAFYTKRNAELTNALGYLVALS